MRIPLNVIHWYIGLPVMVYLAIHGWVATRRGPNTVQMYLAAGATTFLCALIVYVVPVILNAPPALLSWTIFAGDVFQTIALFFIWLVSIRVFLASYPRIQVIAIGIVILISITTMIASYVANTSYYTALVVLDGKLALDYANPQYFAVITALDYIGLLLLSLYFFNQSRVAKASQRWRLWAFAGFFLIIGLTFILQPIFRTDLSLMTMSYLFSAGFIVMAVLSFIAYSVQKKSNNS